MDKAATMFSQKYLGGAYTSLLFSKSCKLIQSTIIKKITKNKVLKFSCSKSFHMVPIIACKCKANTASQYSSLIGLKVCHCTGIVEIYLHREFLGCLKRKQR